MQDKQHYILILLLQYFYHAPGGFDEISNLHLKVNTLHLNEVGMRESNGIRWTLDEGTPLEMKTKWKLMTVYVLSTFKFILPFS